MSKQVLIVGAGFGGIQAALGLASDNIDVKIFDKKGKHVFTPGLIDIFRDRVEGESLRIDLNKFFRGTGIEFVNKEVENIKPGENEVVASDEAYSYDSLVLAAGTEINRNLEGSENTENIYSFESALEASGSVNDSEKIAIIGSGYVGVEVAGEINEMDKDVTVVERETRPLPESSEEASHKVLEYFNQKDVKFQGGRSVERVEDGKIVFEEQQDIEADTVILSTGLKASKLVKDNFNTGSEGLEINRGFSSKKYEDVFAIGDCANHSKMKTAHNSMKQGRIVAKNVVKDDSEELERFEGDKLPIAVSLGGSGMIQWNGKVFRNRFFRNLKDLIRIRYWLILKRRKKILQLKRILP